jgi:hypothetical protein
MSTVPYFSDHDAIIECEALDAEAGEPETWNSWTDQDRWEVSQADVEFINTPEPFVPSEEDLREYHQWCEHVDRLNATRMMEDAEFEARMRFGS